MHSPYTKSKCLNQTSTDNSPWVSINSNNKMIARLTSLRYLLNKTEYDGKKILKPAKWSKSLIIIHQFRRC